MKKYFSKTPMALLLLLSFFISVKNVKAVETTLLTDHTYYNYLNFYSLQFSKDPINKKFYDFFETINFDLKAYFLSMYNEGTIISDAFKNGVISFSSTYNSDSDNFTEYNFFNGGTRYQIPFYLYTYSTPIFKRLGDNYELDMRSTSAYRCYLVYDTSVKENVFGECQTGGTAYVNQKLEFGSIVQNLFSAYYQGSSALFLASEPSTPVGVGGFKFYNNPTIYTSKDYEYLGYEYLDDNLIFGGGNPLYAGYSYFSNVFEYGVPYTSDYGRDYNYGTTNCVYTPTPYLIENYAEIHATKAEKFYIKPIDPKLTTSNMKYSLLTFRHYEDAINDLDLADITEDTPNIRFSELPVKSTLTSFTPLLFGATSVVRIKIDLFTGNAGAGVNIFYHKDYWNSTCEVVGNTINTVDGNGNDISFKFGLISDNRERPWYESILDGVKTIIEFFIETIIFIAEMFGKLLSALKSLGTYILDAIKNILSFVAPLNIIGTNVTLFFNSLPLIVQQAFITIFTIGVLGIIIRLLM